MTPTNYAREVDDFSFTKIESFEKGDITLELSSTTITRSIHIGGAAWKTSGNGTMKMSNYVVKSLTTKPVVRTNKKKWER